MSSVPRIKTKVIRTPDGKTCTKCNIIKPYAEFHKDSSRPDGHIYLCNPCVAQRRKDEWASPEYKAKQRSRWRNMPVEKKQARLNVKRRYTAKIGRFKPYGITSDDFVKMMEAQCNLCGICQIDFDLMPTKHIHLDHCHETGKIRGVLCGRCNAMLGFARDRVDVLYAAVEYLLRL